MISADEAFDGTFPFAPRFSEAPGLRMHYVDEGDGEPIVMLHGELTWGYLYRNFIPELAKTHWVIVPDHMGFDKSETPQDRDYTLKTHVENLAALIEELALREITFVLQDWGGPIGVQYAVRHLERVKRFCFLNALIPGVAAPPRDAAPTPWFEWVRAHHEAGTLHETLGNLDSNVLSIIKIIGFANTAVVDDTWIRAYSAAFPDKASCIGAIEFPLDALLRRADGYVREEVDRIGELATKPAMMVEGMKDHGHDPEVAIMLFRTLYPEGGW